MYQRGMYTAFPLFLTNNRKKWSDCSERCGRCGQHSGRLTDVLGVEKLYDPCVAMPASVKYRSDIDSLGTDQRIRDLPNAEDLPEQQIEAILEANEEIPLLISSSASISVRWPSSRTTPVIGAPNAPST